jgi:quercetin dioxygenase-like cupin family protein
MENQAFHDGLRQDGFDAAVEFRGRPDQVNPEHAHDYDVRALVVEGAITLTVAGESTQYKAGELFVMPHGCPHIEHMGPDGLRALVGRRRAAGREQGDAPAAAEATEH